jgi:hypothetical protein
MRQFLLRAHAHIKRRLVALFAYSPQKAVSVTREEKASEIISENLSTFSSERIEVVYDPRCGVEKTHIFEARHCFRLEDVILEPLQGLIYSKFGNLVKESTPWNPYVLYHTFPWNSDRFVKSIDLHSCIYLSSNAYWHWLIEDLPSTIFALEKYPSSPLLVAANCPPYVQDFLNTVDREIIYLDGPVRVKSIMMVSKGQDSGWPHRDDLSILASYNPFKEAQDQEISSNRVYISRRGSRRSPSNEGSIEEVFEDFGFRILRLEEFNLIDEVKVLSGVSFLAGVHGAGLANLVWMKSGSKVLDIANTNYWTESIHRLAHLKEIQYNYYIYDGKVNDAVQIESLKKKVSEILQSMH